LGNEDETMTSSGINFPTSVGTAVVPTTAFAGITCRKYFCSCPTIHT
jgi:hypothetical protein